MRRLSVAFVVVFTMVVGLGKAHGVCTNASVVGTFGLFNTAGMGSFIGTGIGQITFDGVGGVTGSASFISYGPSDWNNTGGGPITGKYTVAANCTGTVAITDSGGKNTNFNFVLDNGRKGAQLVQTFHSTGTFVQIGFTAAEGKVTCGLGTAKRTFAVNLSGTLVGTGPAGYAGQLILDTKGNVTGSLTLNANGTVTQVPSISGTYTEGSDCTGTAVIMAGGSTLNFDFVVVNSGKELLLLEIDPNTVVSGNAQM